MTRSFMERMERIIARTPAPGSGGLLVLSPEVQEMARVPGRKIPAIKLHREQTGVGLKEAKDAVEAFIESGR